MSRLEKSITDYQAIRHQAQIRPEDVDYSIAFTHKKYFRNLLRGFPFTKQACSILTPLGLPKGEMIFLCSFNQGRKSPL